MAEPTRAPGSLQLTAIDVAPEPSTSSAPKGKAAAAAGSVRVMAMLVRVGAPHLRGRAAGPGPPRLPPQCCNLIPSTDYIVRARATNSTHHHSRGWAVLGPTAEAIFGETEAIGLHTRHRAETPKVVEA